MDPALFLLLQDRAGGVPGRPGAIRRSGVVRINDRGVADDQGPFLALGATMFWLPWAVRHDLDKAQRNLAWLSLHGVHYVRVLGVVGPGGWTDRNIDPNWPDYAEVLARTTDLAYDSFGIRVQWTIFGGVRLCPSQEARQRVVDQVIEMARGREHKIFCIEVANEAWQNGFEGGEGIRELRELGRRLQAGTSNLIALTGPQDDDVCAVYREWTGNAAATLHYQRHEGPWRPVRQAWGWPGEYRDKGDYHEGPLPDVAFNNEPIGPGSSVASENDPLALAFAYITTFLAQNAAYCFHCGAGIRGGGPEDLERGRAANFYEQPAAEEALSAMQALQGVLPPDLPNWDRANAQWANAPFSGLDKAVSAGALVRAFATWRGAEFWLIILGQRRPVTAVPRGNYLLSWVRWSSGQFVGEADVSAGEPFTFDHTEDAVLIHGVRR